MPTKLTLVENWEEEEGRGYLQKLWASLRNNTFVFRHTACIIALYFGILPLESADRLQCISESVWKANNNRLQEARQSLFLPSPCRPWSGRPNGNYR